MAIQVVRDTSRKMKHVVHVRQHAFAVDEPEANGGEDLGITPHEVYDSALGSCKALTVLWYANRKQIPVDDIRVTVDRDDSQEREGLYRLRVGKWRVFFDRDTPDTARIHGIDNRGQAY